MPDLMLEVGAKDSASPAMAAVAASTQKLSNATDTAKAKALELAKAWQRGQGEAALIKKHQDSLTSSTGSMTMSVLKANVAFAAMQKAGALALDFVKDGVSGFIAQEKADRQLSSAVKQLGYDVDTLTPALSSMAQQMENATLVSSDTVKQVQQLILRFGVAPRDIKKTTQAILDWSAANGKDATTGAQLLTKALDGTGEEMKALGVSVGRTGDRSKDLNALVDEMTKKFGGSAAAATEGLGGAMGRLEQAQGDLGKSFGGFVAQIEAKYGVFEGLALAIKGVTAALGGDDDIARSERKQELAKLIADHEERITELQAKRARLGDGPEHRSGRENVEKGLQHHASMLTGYQRELAEIQARINKDTAQGLAEHAAITKNGGTKVVEETEATTAQINEARKKQGEANEHFMKQRHGEALAAMKKLGDDEVAVADIKYQSLQRLRELDQESAERHINALKGQYAREEAEWNRMLGRSKTRAGQLSTATATAVSDEGSDAMYSAGISVGNAFVSGLDQALSETENGGEFDVGAMIATILPVAIAAGLTVAGVPLPLAMLVGSAAGVLVKHGIKEANKGKSSRKKYHSGGWVDDLPRYHDGGLAEDEHVAVLQTGERVLSRREVDGMGGPEGVDSAARGSGGGTRVYVQTLDSLSFQDFMGTRGGAGMKRALVQNRGEFVQALKRRGVK